MTLNLKLPENLILKPTISVFGVGGAGGNAVNNMIRSNLQGATFVAANTDAQALEHSLAENKIQLGLSTTKGLGAGASPEVGMKSAEESEAEIKEMLQGSNMVFITAGMGGGTGTGAAPIIAKIAKEQGILTVAVVTKPFHFEGHYRMKLAEYGLSELQKYVDTLIVIPNQNLFLIANERTTFADAFKMADDVLHAGVRGVTDLMIMPGLINLDFADIRAVMSEMGKAMMGTGESDDTENRAIKASEAAIANPLLDHRSIKGARGVLINITGGNDMTLFEVDAAANRIREEVGDNDANIIFGSTFNKDLEGIIRVSVVATGIDSGNFDKTGTPKVKDSATYYQYKPAANHPAEENKSFEKANNQETSQQKQQSSTDFSQNQQQKFNIDVKPVQTESSTNQTVEQNIEKKDFVQYNNINKSEIANPTHSNQQNIYDNSDVEHKETTQNNQFLAQNNNSSNHSSQTNFSSNANKPRFISPIVPKKNEEMEDNKKPSIFSRMIGSFRSPKPSDMKNPKDDNFKNYTGTTEKIAPIKDSSDLYDVPAFLRRKS